MENFRHPIRDVQNHGQTNEPQLLVIIEMEYLKKITSTRIPSKNPQERLLWQNLGQITNLLQEKLFTQNFLENLNFNIWLEISTLASHVKQIFDKLQNSAGLKEIAVIWKDVKYFLMKFEHIAKSESIYEIEKILSSNTNQFEPLAISFTEKKFGNQNKKGKLTTINIGKHLKARNGLQKLY